MDSVHLIENHDEAYRIWREASVRDRVLVHVDAHHDLYGKWSESKTHRVTIANFIFPALEEGLVREVFWVAPDGSFATARNRRDLRRTVKRIDAESAKRGGARVVEHGMSATVLGRPLTVCRLEDLPSFGEEVLLDVDVDYFVLRDVGGRGARSSRERPWCWPEELVARLGERGLRWDLATIAYSVEGGYTPLQWKYLGDELAARLELERGEGRGRLEDGREPVEKAVEAGVSESVPIELEGMGWMRKGVERVGDGRLAEAVVAYRQAAECLPGSAAPRFHLAHLELAMSEIEAAREHFREAQELDPSYRTAFNSAGLWHHENGRHRQSERAHLRLLELDPEDSYAHLGLGLLALRAKDWAGAEAHLRRSLDFDEHGVDAQRALARVLERQRREAEAIVCYERSLKLAIKGHTSIQDRLIVTAGSGVYRSDSNWADPYHAYTHERLARLYARQGDGKTAIDGFRMALALGQDRAAVRMRLAVVFARRREWRRFWSELGRALAKVPADVALGSRRLFFKLRALPRRALSRRETSGGSSIWS